MPERAGPARPRSSSLLRVGHPRKKRRLSIRAALGRFASRMKRHPTRAEAHLLSALRAAGIKKIGFQVPMLARDIPCILDFKLPYAIVVEVDGGYHEGDDQVGKDFVRDAYLTQSGHHVLRFTNEQVFRNVGGVVALIVKAMESRGLVSRRAP